MTEMLVGMGLGNMVELLEAFDIFLNASVNLLSQKLFVEGDGAFGTIFNLAKEVRKVVTPISLNIVTMLFLIEFIKMSVKFENLKFEHFVAISIKLGLAKGVMDISITMLRWIYNVSCDWIKGIGEIGEQLSFEQYAEASIAQLKNYNFIQQISFQMTAGYLFPIILLSGMLMLIIAYARIFEIMCYVAISPLPCAFIIHENSRITLKFFMSYAAVCLQGVFMVLSIQIVRCLAQNIYAMEYQNVSSTLIYLYNMVIISILSLFVMAKSSQWASKILDAM